MVLVEAVRVDVLLVGTSSSPSFLLASRGCCVRDIEPKWPPFLRHSMGWSPSAQARCWVVGIVLCMLPESCCWVVGFLLSFLGCFVLVSAGATRAVVMLNGTSPFTVFYAPLPPPLLGVTLLAVLRVQV